MASTFHAVIKTSGEQNLVIDVIEVFEDETFHPPTYSPTLIAVEVPDGLPVAGGWTWTRDGGFREPQ
ncbi:hypothetical protein FPV16_14070 [Methylobacterium sp. W2]|uniref:hypothetical protein n=1 Tax=Methylobacterium sp. W2 TaxID=2598107 RepID=UPI001D0C9845|nr:hypothetical protein [Methylobacterium sp. W2]MCC0807347.1 hypothetical protein [Methylobacterium sp. W2]